MTNSRMVRGDLTAPTTPEQCHAAMQRQERVIAELRKRLEAAQKDAQRYQWLRSKDLETIDKGGVFAGQTPENVLLNEEDLDEYIDSEMRQSASQAGCLKKTLCRCCRECSEKPCPGSLYEGECEALPCPCRSGGE